MTRWKRSNLSPATPQPSGAPVRAKLGHPAPFPLQYAGNRQRRRVRSLKELRRADTPNFTKAIKAKYPNLQLIATTTIKRTKVDVIDDHYYKRADEFFDFVHHYDNADRTGPKVFVGEWATREGSPTTNLGAALGDAAWMTAMERNSDLIIMASYAPLFVNVSPGGMQWERRLDWLRCLEELRFTRLLRAGRCSANSSARKSPPRSQPTQAIGSFTRPPQTPQRERYT